jgi:signal transduction histidine kinase
MTTVTAILARPSRRLLGATLPRPATLYLALGVAAIGVYYLLPPDSRDILYVAIGASAVVAVYAASRQIDPERRLAWQLFAVGLMFEVTADAISSFYEVHLDREPPVPSTVDVFYLVGYPLIAAGILFLLGRRGGATTFVGALDTMIVFVAVATVQWIFFVEPQRHVDAGFDARLVGMAYPSMGVLFLVGLAQLLVGVRGRSTAYRLLIVSVALWIAADEVFGLNASGYTAGGWVDALWLGSYVVFGVAALAAAGETVPELAERRAVPRLTPARLTLLAAALFAVPVALAIDRLQPPRSHSFAAAIGASLIAGLVLVRLSGLVRIVDHARLDERRTRREAEDARALIEEQNIQLRELDRLKDEFVSSVSHELRTPLTSITGYVELLLDEAEDEQVRAHLRVVERNAGRLLALVSDLLFAARLQSGHLELDRDPVDVAALVADTVESARLRAEAGGIELTVRAEPIPPVEGERDRLVQLFDNLVSNAIKFTPAGGDVEIALAPAVGGGVSIEVSDTGIGIPEADRERLFERFFRSQAVLERHIPGTGLGLYISKAIVEAHGGRIAVRSEQGAGTTFLVELPAVRLD